MTSDPALGAVALDEAYRATSYRVFLPGEVLEIRVDQACEPLDRVLEQLGVRCWAFVSAANPASRRLSDTENRGRQDELARYIAEHGWSSFPGDGVGDTGDWPAEPSFLVLGIEERASRALGRRYGQNAVVWGERGGTPRLLWCL